MARRKRVANIHKTLRGVAGDVRIRTFNGQFIITGKDEQQKTVRSLLDQLRVVSGPQVNVASRQIAGQRAKGIKVDRFLTGGKTAYVSDLNAVYLSGRPAFDPTVQTGGSLINDAQFQTFIDSNYDWARRTPDGGTLLLGGQVLSGERTADESKLARALGRNWGQKIVVNSKNLNVDNPTATSLGIRFRAGANGVIYSVVDEAQMRTLLELNARNAAQSWDMAWNISVNGRRQETIVGTDALLANDMLANATFADDRSNTIDIADNPIRLAHSKYVLIDNGSYLTAVRAGAMQHWTETPADVRFAEVPVDIDVPHVGQLVKFEKTLVEPTDLLVLRATYEWKGN